MLLDRKHLANCVVAAVLEIGMTVPDLWGNTGSWGTQTSPPSLSITAIRSSNRPNSCEYGTLIRCAGKMNQI